MRSLRGIASTRNDGYDTYEDIFNNLISKTYFSDKRKEYIFTGLALYDKVRELLLGDTDDRDKIRSFEKFIGDAFFNGKDVNIVPRLKDTLHIKIGKEERAIHDLGDGIQSIIILTYPLFFNQGTNAVFFFEEPEMHLHPGFQRLFIETLQREDFKSFQYFITTHSNHFLDITLDYDNISIYALHKEEETKKFHINNVSTGDHSVLSLIGARTSSVFLSNCTIWVEGITDRIYLRKYLELYQKDKPNKFKEDYHYSFVEYAGNNITHWSFLDSDDPNHSNINVERLCAKLFLITDKDGAGLNKDGSPSSKSTKKQERHRKLAARLKDRYYCLNCREIENLLSPEIIKKVVANREPKNTGINYDKFNKKVYINEYLGKFIDDNIIGKTKTYAYRKTTINKKPEFAKDAVSNMKSFDDLSAEAKKLTIKLYHFIQENNS
jgi:predicted ATP-dependent endonuclease of OLD family